MNNPPFNIPIITFLIQDIIELKNLKCCFCIDTSTSTNSKFADKYTILDIEKIFCSKMEKYLNYKPKYISWNSFSQVVSNMDELYPQFCTLPNCIFDNNDTLNELVDTQIMILITDGEIPCSEINKFYQCIKKYSYIFCGIINVIVGRRTNSINTMISPNDINISVLSPGMINNSCILFYNTKNIYAMKTNGCFSSWNIHNITDDTNWCNISTQSFEEIANTKISIENMSLKKSYIEHNYIPLGNGILFNPTILLESNIPCSKLMNLPFEIIFLHYKLTNSSYKLFKWLECQKNNYINDLIEKYDKKYTEEKSLENFLQLRNISLIDKHFNDNINDLLNTNINKECILFYKNSLNSIYNNYLNENNSNSYVMKNITKNYYVNDKYLQNNDIIDMNFFNIYNCYNWRNNHNIERNYKCHICNNDTIPIILLRDMINNDYYDKILCHYCSAFYCITMIDPIGKKFIMPIPLLSNDELFSDEYLNCFRKIVSHQINKIQLLHFIKNLMIDIKLI